MRGALAVGEPDKVSLARCQLRHGALKIAALLRLHREVATGRRLVRPVFGQRRLVPSRPTEPGKEPPR